MEYKLITGETLKAESFEGIIIAMKGQNWERDISVEEYMKRVSERVKTQSGHDIRFDSAEIFVKDMIASGYFIKV